MTRRHDYISAPHAFTLIELVVAVVLLAIIAAVAAPRFTGAQARRAADAEAEALRALLSSLAQRHATTPQPLALLYSSQTRTFTIQTRTAPAPTRSGFLPAAVWLPDPLSTPLTLSATELRAALSGYQPFAPGDFRIALPTAEPRPDLSILLAPRSASAEAPAWRIDLPSHATAATRSPDQPASRLAPLPSRAIDLDAAGRSRTPW